MSERAIFGSIQAIQGSGSVVVVRSTGESFVAKLGDVVLAGDIVTTSNASSVLINVNLNSLEWLDGVVLVGNATTVSFIDTLFDGINSLLPNSSQENPISIGTTLTLESIRQFDEVLASSGQVQTANDESQSDTVANLGGIFLPPSAELEPNAQNLPQNAILAHVFRNAPEIFPGNNSEEILKKDSNLAYGNEIVIVNNSTEAQQSLDDDVNPENTIVAPRPNDDNETDVDEAPTISAQSFNYAENQVAGAQVAAVVAADDAAVTGYTFTSTGTNTSSDTFYSIDSSGQITITAAGAASEMNNFESGSNSVVHSVTVTDAAGNTSAAYITLNEDNVNITATDNTNNVNENSSVTGNAITDGTADSDDLSAGTILNTGLTLHYDASEDTAGDGIWDNTSATPPTPDLIWDFDASGTNFSPIDVSASTSFVGITEAYRFNVDPGDITGAGLSNLDGDDASINDIDGAETRSASFEIWFRANDISDADVLFETGGSGDGTSIQINGTVVKFIVIDTIESVHLSFDLASIGIDPTDEFVQLTGVIDISGGTSKFSLYVNGTLAAQETNPLVLDWGGTNPAGLGATNQNINFNTPTAFEGEIAIFNLYESALNNVNVLDNFQAISGFSVTEVNGTAITLDTPMSLTNGSLIVAADGSYQYTPTTSFNGLETFTYTIENNNGDVDTATITINVTNAVDGTAGADTLNDTAGNDFLTGYAGGDTLIASAGQDILFGGMGSDTLTGGNDADTFFWQAADADGSTDTITDFVLGEAGTGTGSTATDIIDLADLLQNEENGLLSDFLQITDDGTDVTITVDADGAGGYTDLSIVIEDIGTGSIDLDALINSNQIIVDV
ncbi:MAG: hypothetical protein ACI8VC_000072 [Candidatus Endobugula sp.]|jgi:hypothetical protein